MSSWSPELGSLYNYFYVVICIAIIILIRYHILMLSAMTALFLIYHLSMIVGINMQWPHGTLE